MRYQIRRSIGLIAICLYAISFALPMLEGPGTEVVFGGEFFAMSVLGGGVYSFITAPPVLILNGAFVAGVLCFLCGCTVAAFALSAIPLLLTPLCWLVPLEDNQSLAVAHFFWLGSIIFLFVASSYDLTGSLREIP